MNNQCFKLPDDLPARIEHTNLNPSASKEAIVKLCNEAITYKLKGICVHPSHIHLAKETIATAAEQHTPKIVTVVGFPLGCNTTFIKVQETIECVKLGADEIDMVINFGLLQDNQYEAVGSEILALKQACEAATNTNGQTHSIKLKCILETCYLSKEQIAKACQLATTAGADYVKTSTGMGSRGASVEDIQIMKQSIAPHMRIKASGGIKNIEHASAMFAAGADVIGTSSGVAISQGVP